MIAAAFALLAACSPAAAPARFTSMVSAPAYQNAALLKQASELPVATEYADVGFECQANPSVCGPTTVANMVQLLGHNETQSSLLRDAKLFNIFGPLPGGVTLDQAGQILARESGREVTVLPASISPRLMVANDPHFRFLINFDRQPLFRRRHGHFSVFLGYLRADNLVFVGDVNEDFKPWPASPERVFSAMNTLDSATSKSRGLLGITLTGDLE